MLEGSEERKRPALSLIEQGKTNCRIGPSCRRSYGQKNHGLALLLVLLRTSHTPANCFFSSSRTVLPDIIPSSTAGIAPAVHREIYCSLTAYRRIVSPSRYLLCL